MSRKEYNHKEIEAKWQRHWKETEAFKVEADPQKPKYYVLDMFPYPSGAGLHVGHVEGYTASDIVARFKRHQGYNVLHPIGWDSFGLPAEQYAIRTGTHPAQTTELNIQNFKRQLQSLGFSYDWSREFATSDPKHYKWTQWIFTKLYEKGLAYEAEVEVNYCPHLKTVLANEEVENGLSVEGGYPVIRKPLKQWMLKITEYAERLLEDLDELDWPENIKKQQKNWIGKSTGVRVEFPLEKDREKRVSVFTTCPDTLFGVTFAVLSPEHPLVNELTTPEQSAAIEKYRKEVQAKSEIDRTELNKDKTGVFTGGYILNPITNEKVPVWIADYVLMSYGTGAVMAVPGHDERDYEFATKYNLPIRCVIEPSIDAIEGDEPEKTLEAIRSSQEPWFGPGTIINSSFEDFSMDGLTSKEAKQKAGEWIELHGYGAFETNYKLRDWLFSRQRYWGEPFPLLTYEDGTRRLLDEEELPLIPPELDDFKPSEEGYSPLAKAEDWVNTYDQKMQKPARRETNTMPQWAGSCWYYLRFLDPLNEAKAWDELKENYWMPVDLYIGGGEHAVLHLLYARFWHKVLFDCGLVSTKEPFYKLRNQGMIVSRSYRVPGGVYVAPEDVSEKEGGYYHKESGEKLVSQLEKMSKSKLNGVTPDELLETYGADAIRLYEMFMGPLEKEKVWNTKAVSGCRRFLVKLFDLVQSDKVSDETTDAHYKLGYTLVKGVVEDTQKLLFNTAISKMMEFVNGMSKQPTYSNKVLKWVAICLHSYAPHIAQEIWSLLGETGLVDAEGFPEINESYLKEDKVSYAIQINGKLRSNIQISADAEQDVVLDAAKQEPKVQKYLDGFDIVKVIFVPKRLLNIVIKPSTN